jgi:hypothetical protein
MATTVPELSAEPSVVRGWIPLCTGIVAMMVIATLPYAWTLFLKLFPISLYSSLPAIQVAFVTFMLAGARLVLLEDYIADSFSPRVAIGTTGALAGMGWIKPELVTTARRSF